MNTYTLIGQQGKLCLEVEAIIQTQKKGEEMTEKREYMPAPMTEGNPVYLTIGAGAAKPFGEAKVYVSITYPCQPDNVDESYEKIKNWLDFRLSKEVEELFG